VDSQQRMVGTWKLSVEEQKRLGCHVFEGQIEGRFGPYTLINSFGNGTQGDTRHCKNANDERFVIKFFPLKQCYKSFNFAKRIQIWASSAELTAHETFFHTGIEKVPLIKDLGRTLIGGIPFIVMELLGPNLNTMLEAVGYEHFTNPSALKLTYQLVLCLEAIHSVNIIHRDIKPANFCFARNPTNGKLIVKIIDFGCSAIFNPMSLKSLPNKVLSRCIGTEKFASRAAHLTTDLCPYDDLESLFYLSISFFRGDKLAWAENGRTGERFFRLKTNFWRYAAFGCDPLNTIFKHIQSLKREDEIQYDELKSILLEQFANVIYEQEEDALVAICDSERRTITAQLDKYYAFNY